MILSCDGHLTETELLLAAEGELSAEVLAQVRAHLSGCPQCAEALNRLREFDELLVSAGEHLAFRKGLKRRRRKAAWSAVLPSVRWGAPATLAALIAALLMAPPNAELSARECLDWAAASEDSRRWAPRRIHLRTATREWTLHGTLQSGGDDPDLDRWRRALDQAGVDWDALLSARGYRRWSESVPKKRQEVQRRAGELCIITRTSGRLRRAELMLHADSYLPSASVWEFEDLGELRAAGEAEPQEPAAAEMRRKPAGGSEAPRPAVPLPPPDLEATELEVRLALHELRADLGEPVEVRRVGVAVRVEGIADTKERLDALRQRLAAIPHVEFRVLWPDEAVTHASALAGGAPALHRARPALAEEWMKARFADPGEAQQFALRTLELVGEIQARDHALRTLAERYPHQLPPPSAEMLETLRTAHRRQLTESWCGLARQLWPLLHPDSGDTPAPVACEELLGLSSTQRDALPLIIPLVSWGNADIGLEETFQRLRAVFLY